MDEATSLLQQGRFNRRTVDMLCSVLEDGWAEVSVRFKGRAAEKAGRMNIADGILRLAKAGQRDPKLLKLYAVSRAHALLGPPGYYRLN
jgi:hypothetical protein